MLITFCFECGKYTENKQLRIPPHGTQDGISLYAECAVCEGEKILKKWDVMYRSCKTQSLKRKVTSC